MHFHTTDSRNYEQGSLTGRPVGAHGGSQNPQESDLFSFLSSMHLSGSGVTSGSASNGDNIVGSNVNVNASAAAQANKILALIVKGGSCGNFKIRFMPAGKESFWMVDQHPGNYWEQQSPQFF